MLKKVKLSIVGCVARLCKAVQFRDTVGSVIVAEKAKIARLQDIVADNKLEVASIDAELDELEVAYSKEKVKNADALSVATKELAEKHLKELKKLKAKHGDIKLDASKKHLVKFEQLKVAKTVAVKEIKDGSKILVKAQEALGL